MQHVKDEVGAMSWEPQLEGGKTGYRDLVRALETDIRSGRLAPGAKLPTHRELSTRLEISRGTVARAYDEAQRLGLLRSGIGQGTFVADAYVVRAQQEATDGLIDFGLGFPLYELDPDPAPVLRELAQDAERFELLQYPPPGGWPRQRRAATRWCAELGVRCDGDEIFVTLGAQHAAHLWFLAVLRPGDTLLCAELTYRMIISAAQGLEIRVRGVAMDDEGILPDALEAAVHETAARGLYIMPTIQNPTSGVLSPARRRALLEVAERHNLHILEDDIHGLFHPAPRPTPLKHMRPERVTYVASLSKIVAGGLRVAYAVPPEGHRPAYRSALLTSMYAAPSLTTEVVSRWIEDGTARRVVQAKTQEAAWRRQRVHEVLGPWVPRMRSGAYYAWIDLPAPWTAVRFVLEARRRDVSVMPAEPFYVGDGQAPEAIRVSMGAVSRQQLERGLGVLRELLEHPVAAQALIV